ncbi:MAG TPA: hypothetical protein VLI06_19140 [Solimonas sp.]|nr:hypothetical protein [Solimonas sp.]
MGAKDELLLSLIRTDASGRTQLVHDALLGIPLKFKGSSNSATLLYYFGSTSSQGGIAALRGSPALFSFPKTFWSPRRDALNAALAQFPRHLLLPTEGPVSSSQHSIGQVQITAESIEPLLALITSLIASLARQD